MKKFFLCAVVAVVFGFYVWQTRGTSAPVSDTNLVAMPTPLADTPPPSSSQGIVVSKPAPVPTPTVKYREGTYTGSVADAFFGNIQVVAVVSGGRIQSVKILQYPNDREHSIKLNSEALPRLISQAIRNQDAQVNIVSGATDTSLAFRESLAFALRQAQN